MGSGPGIGHEVNLVDFEIPFTQEIEDCKRYPGAKISKIRKPLSTLLGVCLLQQHPTPRNPGDHYPYLLSAI